jgi:membrane protease YdiL (CAAX protease family)
MEKDKRAISWRVVVTFYLIALAISGPFFYWRTILDWRGFTAPGFLKSVSYMWGPGIAGLICYAIFRRSFKKQITIEGFSALKSAMVWIVPFCALAAIGLKTKTGTDHATPLSLIGIGLLTIWGEEVGWRWFLQDYLASMRPLKKYLLVGVLWEFWHLRFLSRLHEPIWSIALSTVATLVIVAALSIIIGYVTDRTRSLTFACTLHAWVDMLAEFPQMSTYIAAGIAIALCAYYCFVDKGRPSRLAAGINPDGAVQ